MTTITYRPGERRVEFIAAETDDGSPLDLSGATGMVSVQAGAVCHDLPLTPAEGGFEWPLTPEAMPQLAGDQAYPATVRIIQDDETTLTDLVLYIEKGC